MGLSRDPTVFHPMIKILWNIRMERIGEVVIDELGYKVRWLDWRRTWYATLAWLTEIKAELLNSQCSAK